MFKKILTLVFILNFLSSCEYKPIYSNSNKSNYRIITGIQAYWAPTIMRQCVNVKIQLFNCEIVALIDMFLN